MPPRNENPAQRANAGGADFADSGEQQHNAINDRCNFTSQPEVKQ
jgi:hypothetical protein